MGKCLKGAFFLMASRGWLYWFQKEVQLYVSLWENASTTFSGGFITSVNRFQICLWSQSFSSSSAQITCGPSTLPASNKQKWRQKWFQTWGLQTKFTNQWITSRWFRPLLITQSMVLDTAVTIVTTSNLSTRTLWLPSYQNQQFTAPWFPLVKHCGALLISSSFVSVAMGWRHFQERVQVQHQHIFGLEYMTLLVLFWSAGGVPLRWGHRCESLAVLQVVTVVQLSFTNCGSAAVERRDCRRLLVTWNTQPGVNVEIILP